MQLSTQFSAYRTLTDFDKYQVDTFELTEIITREQFTNKPTHAFCLLLHMQTGTDHLCQYTSVNHTFTMTSSTGLTRWEKGKPVEDAYSLTPPWIVVQK